MTVGELRAEVFDAIDGGSDASPEAQKMFASAVATAAKVAPALPRIAEPFRIQSLRIPPWP